MLYNIETKKAQMGDTVTWLVATVIIIIILMISIFTVSFAFNKKFGPTETKKVDPLASRSLFSYLLTKDGNGKAIYSQLREEENLNEFNGNLGQNIFSDFYKEEYSKTWVGTVSNKEGQQGLSLENNYFGKRGGGVKEVYDDPLTPHISDSIKLDEENSVNLLLVKK